MYAQVAEQARCDASLVSSPLYIPRLIAYLRLAARVPSVHFSAHVLRLFPGEHVTRSKHSTAMSCTR